jgi:tyrosinase
VPPNQGDATEKPGEDVQNLVVSVVSSEVTLPTNEDQFPVHGAYTVHPEITQGRPAGHNPNDQV